MTPIQEAALQDFRNFIGGPKVNTIGNLWGRWQDEKEFEDFKEYTKVMAATLEDTKMTLVKGSKRPFGMVVKHADLPFNVLIAVTGGSAYFKKV